MSYKKVEQVKADRGFKLADLIIYAVIAALIAAAFIAVFALRDTSSFKGFKVYSGNAEVFEYNFQNNTYNIPAVEGVTVEVTAGQKLTVTVRAGEGYNVLEVDASARAVRVTGANCAHSDCVYAAPITDNNGVIYCAPHRLRIIPYGFDANGNDILI